MGTTYESAKANFEQNVSVQPIYATTNNIGTNSANFQAKTAFNPNVINQATNKKNEPIVVQSNLYLDGEQIYKSVEQRSRDEMNRN